MATPPRRPRRSARRIACLAAGLLAVLPWAFSGVRPAGAADAAVPAVTGPGPAGAGPWAIGDELWDRPRSAEAIRAQPALRAAVSALLGTAGTTLVIRHAAGQNDGLRAEELRHWLVALAVEPGRIVLVPAAGASLEGQARGTLLLELAR